MGRNLVISVLVVLGVVYFFVDPAASRFMPQCMFHTVTGWDCPGCGSQRMLHALLHGNLREAWNYNAFLLVSLPFILFLLVLELAYKKYPRLYMRVHSVPVVVAVCIVIVAWGIGRNLIGN
ncbi:MAG: DUF2752 domain-containing protein [Muribaculaceae bacterium]|nr:DUF2752 domain-containing protein [Muribaculaceae bacterium]